MQGLTTAQLLDLVEAGHGRSWAARGLLLLGCAWPNSAGGQRAALSCGERDRALIHLRIATFGRQAPVYTACADCGGELEAEFDLWALVDSEPPEGAATAAIEAGGRTLTVRPLNSGDFLAVEGLAPEEAGRELVRRTISPGGEPPPEVDRELRAKVAGAVCEMDPLSRIELAFACEDCGRSWSETLDIVDLFWKEIEAAARRAAWQVHALASAYGWTEKTILDLTPARRSLYLRMVAHG